MLEFIIAGEERKLEALKKEKMKLELEIEELVRRARMQAQIDILKELYNSCFDSKGEEFKSVYASDLEIWFKRLEVQLMSSKSKEDE